MPVNTLMDSKRSSSTLPLLPNRALITAAICSGAIDTAEKLADSWLEREPDSMDAQYCVGLVLLEQQATSDAIVWLSRAQQKQPENILYNCDLGSALHRDGQYKKSLKYLKKALAVDNKHEVSLFNLGCSQLELTKFKAALKTFKELNTLNPGQASYLCAKGDAHRKLNQWPLALRHYQLALNADSNFTRAHINAAPILLQIGKEDQALEHCRAALELEPNNTTALKNLGDCLLHAEELDEAMDVYADAFELAPDSIELCIAIAQVWLEVSNLHEANFWFHKACEIDENNIEAKAGIAFVIKEQGDSRQAVELLEPLIEEDPENISIRLSLSDALWDEGDAETAISHLKTVIEQFPQRVATHAKVGQLLSSSGDIDGAIKEYNIALKQNPNCIPALSGLASTQRIQLDYKYVQRMERLLTSEKIREGAKSSLHNGLAYYYDGVSKQSHEAVEEAAKHMSDSNRSHWAYKSKRGWEYDKTQHEDHVSQLIEHFNPAFFTNTKDWGIADNTPVFIVGMPRSGTTLTEQILARHHQVLGIGERNLASQCFYAAMGAQERNDMSLLQELEPAYVKQLGREYLGQLEIIKRKELAADAVRIVDKMPDNYSLLGWIATLFPNAKIIHCNRDPRDVALSCWMTQFGAIRWACKTDHLVHRVQQYRRIMAHWRNTLYDRFIEINYEDLVANQELESKRLVDWIGLDWDENCLRFFESDRLIRTASITQVRQPIYTRSVARWEKYEKLIPDLFDPITEMLKA